MGESTQEAMAKTITMAKREKQKLRTGESKIFPDP
jgi:hypothetical protein